VLTLIEDGTMIRTRIRDLSLKLNEVRYVRQVVAFQNFAVSTGPRAKRTGNY